MNDMQLLEDYAVRNSQEAFAALVQRHINLVYSVALRYVGDPHKAQDVTQSKLSAVTRLAVGNRFSFACGWAGDFAPRHGR